jgi:hypothetical protein
MKNEGGSHEKADGGFEGIVIFMDHFVVLVVGKLLRISR